MESAIVRAKAAHSIGGTLRSKQDLQLLSHVESKSMVTPKVFVCPCSVVVISLPFGPKVGNHS